MPSSHEPGMWIREIFDRFRIRVRKHARACRSACASDLRACDSLPHPPLPYPCILIPFFPHNFQQFLDVSSHLYKRLCLSVHPSVSPSVIPSISHQFAKNEKNCQTSLLESSSHLYKRMCLSVRPSIGRSIRQSSVC